MARGLLILVLLASVAHADPKRGDVLFAVDFNGPDALNGWSRSGQAAIQAGPPSVLVVRRDEVGSSNVTLTLPLEQLRGWRCELSGRVKADAVTQPSHPWSGLKVMVHSDGPGGPQWSNPSNVWGTFDWKTVSCPLEIPADATVAQLILGLEDCRGQASFERVQITAVRRQRRRPDHPLAPTPEDRRTTLPRLRGAMISPNCTADDLLTLGRDWHANLVRWQLPGSKATYAAADSRDLPAFDRDLAAQMQHLDAMLPVCRQAGLLVLIDLHSPPGGSGLFEDRRYQDKFLAFWEEQARRYRGNPTVWGYDLLNEPNADQIGDGLRDWPELAAECARRVRALDPDHAIIVEPDHGGAVQALDWLEPLDVPGVVYSPHFYTPIAFTHQGVFGKSEPVSYPGLIDGRQWDKAALRAALQPAIDWQHDYGKPIYFGEFSAIRWAPDDSGLHWLTDLTDIFEEMGWDWSYHAWREWDGWSVEHGSDPNNHQRLADITPRGRLLRGLFAKNAKP
jgi:hypothetical protein